MAQDRKPKLWYPAHFTHGGIRGSENGPFGSDAIKQHAVIILNNPLENRDMLIDACIEGIHRVSKQAFMVLANIRSISSLHCMC